MVHLFRDGDGSPAGWTGARSGGSDLAGVLLLAALSLPVLSCESAEGGTASEGGEATGTAATDESAGDEGAEARMGTSKMGPAPDGLERATFAGGCFWCMEPPFETLDGVESVVSGYTGGDGADPSYREVSSGRTDHAEAVRIHYDPEVVSYRKLLRVFWQNIDPTAEDRQFVDVGAQYRTAIYYHTDRQKRLAAASKRKLAANGPFDETIVTPLEPAGAFWRAEAYHQDFYKEKPDRYTSYRNGSGRDEFIAEHWSGVEPSEVWGNLSDAGQ